MSSHRYFRYLEVMAAYSTLLPQKPSRLLQSAQRAPRSARAVQKVSAQAQPSRLIVPGRSNTAIHAAATLETPPATSAKEKPLGEGPTVINGQVCVLRPGLLCAASLAHAIPTCNHLAASLSSHCVMKMQLHHFVKIVSLAFPSQCVMKMQLHQSGKIV